MLIIFCAQLWLGVPVALGQVLPTRLAIGATDYPTESAILITAVGAGGDGSPALACFISNTSTAEWYYPDGTVVTLGSSPAADNTIISLRQTIAITLHRGNGAISPTGLYCCGSPTLPVDQRLCINLLAECPSLTAPTNGVITYNPPGSPTSEGTIATYQCNTGYTLYPEGTRTCQSDGMWSGGEPTCAVDCGSPPSITNGSPGTPTRITFGGTVIYTCNSGYQISTGVTTTTVTCLSTCNGMWGTPQTCTVVDCGPPPTITNGSPGTPTSTTFGGTVTYTCDNGFTLSGSAMITCLAAGSWSTPPSCTDPDSPPVYLSLSYTNYFTNNSVIETSSIGETNEDALVCHTDLSTCCRGADNPSGPMGMGEWVFPNGTNVPRDGSSNNDYFRTRDTKLIRLHQRNNNMTTGLYCCVIPIIGGERTFCASLAPVGSVTTTTTTITTTIPPVPTCSDLTVPANGMVMYSSGTDNVRPVSSTVTYSCVDGYILNGGSTRTCLSDGMWSGEEPTCDALPPVYLSLSSTNYITSGSAILLSSVGEGDGSYLSCHTDDTNCCSEAESGVVGGVGSWHYPNGSAVSSDGGDLYISRGLMVVNLNRGNDVMGPTGLYCCVVPISAGTGLFCAILDYTSLDPPCSLTDNTGAIVGGVVGLILGLALILAITAIVIAYLVLKQNRVKLKREPPDIPLTDKGQSVPQQTYETIDVTYEEISGTRPLKGNYDYSQNQSYVATTAPLRGEGVVTTGESGNPTEDSQVGRDENMIYEN